MSDIDSLFPPDNNKTPANLRSLTRENASARLATIACPHCDKKTLATFGVSMHVGVMCRGCGREHVLRRYGIQWLPGAISAWRKGKLP